MWFGQSLFRQFVCARRASLWILKMFRNTATTKTVVIFWTQNRVFQDIEANETKEISIDCGHKPFLVIALYIRCHISRHSCFVIPNVLCWCQSLCGINLAIQTKYEYSVSWKVCVSICFEIFNKMIWSASNNYRFGIQCLKRLFQTGIFWYEIGYLLPCD